MTHHIFPMLEPMPGDVAAEIIIRVRCPRCHQVYTQGTKYWQKLYELPEEHKTGSFLSNHFGAIEDALVGVLFRGNPCCLCVNKPTDPSSDGENTNMKPNG